MKRYNALLFCAFISTVICFSACTNSTTIGADLLESDNRDIFFSEDFVMQTSTRLGDSVLTFNPILNFQLTDYVLGEYQDPIFGKVRSSIYAQVSTTGTPNFTGNNLDSVVLVLPYRVSEEYGNIETEYTIDILRIEDDAPQFNNILDNPFTDFLWSDFSFDTQMTPIGSKTFVPPNTADSIFIQIPKQDSLGFNDILVSSQLRIPLDADFAEELFNAETNMPDDSIFFSDDKFTAYLNGIHIKPVSENEGLLDFGLLNNGNSNSNGGIFVYYNTPANGDDIATNKSYQFPFSSDDIKATSYRHDYTGSMVEEFINEPAMGDSLFFTQGLAGVNGTIKFPNLDNLRGDIAINKAELILTVAELPEDSDIYELPAEIFLTEITADGTLVIIEDARTTSLFGGDLKEYTDDRPAIYSMNITAHLQNVLKGSATDEMGVVVLGRERSPNRVVFCGGGHSTHPVKLRVHYTQF